MICDDDRSARPTYDELKAKHGPNWGLKTEDQSRRDLKIQVPENDRFRQWRLTTLRSERSPPTSAEIVEHYRNYNLGFKPKPKPPTESADERL